METYDIYFKEGTDFANKGFSLKDKAKAIRMAEDMLAERKGYVKDYIMVSSLLADINISFSSRNFRYISPFMLFAGLIWIMSGFIRLSDDSFL